MDRKGPPRILLLVPVRSANILEEIIPFFKRVKIFLVKNIFGAPVYQHTTQVENDCMEGGHYLLYLSLREIIINDIASTIVLVRIMTQLCSNTP